MSNLEVDKQDYLNMVSNKLPKNPVLIDIGFNHGDFTYEFLKRFPDAHVLGYEPIKDLYELGYQKIVDNNFNIELFNHGFSNKAEGAAPFYFLQGALSGMSGLYYRPEIYSGIEVQEISVRLLIMGELKDELPKADYIKIDTEVHELSILQGAKEYLAAKPAKYIQFEYGGCCKDNGVKGKDIITLLESYKYIVRDKTFMHISAKTFEENYVYQNFLAIYRG